MDEIDKRLSCLQATLTVTDIIVTKHTTKEDLIYMYGMNEAIEAMMEYNDNIKWDAKDLKTNNTGN